MVTGTEENHSPLPFMDVKDHGFVDLKDYSQLRWTETGQRWAHHQPHRCVFLIAK
jgi:hypothetical protein